MGMCNAMHAIVQCRIAAAESVQITDCQRALLALIARTSRHDRDCVSFSIDGRRSGIEPDVHANDIKGLGYFPCRSPAAAVFDRRDILRDLDREDPYPPKTARRLSMTYVSTAQSHGAA